MSKQDITHLIPIREWHSKVHSISLFISETKDALVGFPNRRNINLSNQFISTISRIGVPIISVNVVTAIVSQVILIGVIKISKHWNKLKSVYSVISSTSLS